MHIDNKKKDILVPGESPAQGLEDTLITEEAKCSINFTRSKLNFCLNLQYNVIMEEKFFYLLMLSKYINSNQKTLK